MKKFKPMLAPNQKVNLTEINYPVLASTKLDGIRIIFYKGEILTRSLKTLPNKQLNEKFETIRKYTEDNNIILDGEIYSHELNFQQIISYCMTENFENKKSIKKFGKVLQIPEHLKFYCFDCIKDDNFELEFIKRCMNIVPIAKKFEKIMFFIDQIKVNSEEQVNEFFETVLEKNYEGLILKSFDDKYKCGRGTLKEGLIYKVKPFLDFDGQIIEVVQSTEVNEDVEKKTNELGRSVTSKKIGNRHLIDKASAFVVKYEDKELKVTLAMTDEQKKEVWKNKNDYINKWITYKGMLIGAKDVVRHPVFLRFRDEK